MDKFRNVPAAYEAQIAYWKKNYVTGFFFKFIFRISGIDIF